MADTAEIIRKLSDLSDVARAIAVGKTDGRMSGGTPNPTGQPAKYGERVMTSDVIQFTGSKPRSRPRGPRTPKRIRRTVSDLMASADFLDIEDRSKAWNFLSVPAVSCGFPSNRGTVQNEEQASNQHRCATDKCRHGVSATRWRSRRRCRRPIGSIPIGPISIGPIPIGSIPIGSIPAGSGPA
jgi:hypothetical protein